jgi:hypothetical protein
METRCRSARRDGGACGARPGLDGYCFSHSPAHREEAAAARVKGGLHRKRGKPRDPNAPRPSLRTPGAIVAWIEEQAARAACLDDSPASVKAALQAGLSAWSVVDKVRTDARLRRMEQALGLDELELEDLDLLGGTNVES